MPEYSKSKEILESGCSGEIRDVAVRNTTKLREKSLEAELPWRVIPEISGGGHFMDIGCHSLDLLDFLLGPIRQANGHIGNQAGFYRAEDIVSASFVFESGVQGSVLWCFTAFEHVDLTEIVGDKGKISFSTFGTDPIVCTNETGIVEYPIETPRHVQQPLIQTIVNELLGLGQCPSHGDSAVRTSWVMDQIMKSN